MTIRSTHPLALDPAKYGVTGRPIVVDVGRPAVSDRLYRRALSLLQPVGSCLVYRGHIKDTGYGAIEDGKGNRTYVHRLVFAACTGRPIPRGRLVLHKAKCQHRACGRFDHLFLGSHKAKVRQTKRRGTFVKPPRVIGEKNHKANLSDRQVAEIRRRWKQSPHDQRALAAKFKCSQSTVWRLVHNIVRAEGRK